MGLELGEGHLDWIEVGAVGRQEVINLTAKETETPK
jgi:hypothetical protein